MTEYTVGEFQVNQYTTEDMIAEDQQVDTFETAIEKAKELSNEFEFGEIIVGVWGGDADELLALVVDGKVFTVQETF